MFGSFEDSGFEKLKIIFLKGFQVFTVGNTPALRGGPCTDFTALGPDPEIFVRLAPWCFDDPALDPDLSFKLGPKKEERTNRICCYLNAFPAMVVGEKGKSVILQVFKQYNP